MRPSLRDFHLSRLLLLARFSFLALLFAGGLSIKGQAQQIPGMPGSAADAALGRGVSESKLGSVLFYNYYTSDAANTTINTRLSITNANPQRDIAIHLFFVDSTTCNIADSHVCLTRNQTASFLASDLDPNVSGYLMAVAVDALGRPAGFNFLAGDELVVTPTGHRFSLAAVAAARRDGNFSSPANVDGSSATMYFNNVQYDALPFTMVLDNFPSQTAGVGASVGDTRLYVYTPVTDLAVGTAPSASIFFLIRDDAENTFSGALPYTCYLSSDKQRITSVRTAPNLNTIVPAGQSGWASFYAIGNRNLRCNAAGATVAVGNLPLMGATATRTGNFTGGHNLRYATTFSTPGYSISMPIVPPSCGGSIDLPTSDSSLCL